MPEYLISYQSNNHYSNEMKYAHIEFLVLPANLSRQERLSYSIETTPMIQEHVSRNSFGFEVVQFRLEKKHQNFELNLQSRVKCDEVNPFDFISLGFEEERSHLTSDEFAIDNYPFGQFTPLTTLPDNLSYPELDKQETVFDFAQRLNDYVHSCLKYDDTIKNPERNILDTLKSGTGVCQDYAHLMLALLRKNGIPARYVSGYLNQGKEFVGTGAIHAWVQAMIPGAGWLGFDPTNNLMEDHNYIKIAHGVDITDCHNVKGVVTGFGTNKTDYNVLVKEQNRIENQ